MAVVGHSISPATKVRRRSLCRLSQAMEGQLVAAVQRAQQLESQLADLQAQLSDAQARQQEAAEAADALRQQLSEAGDARDAAISELEAARQRVSMCL